MVQHRALRWIHGYGPRERFSVTELQAVSKFCLLEDRRRDQRLTMMYKVSKGLVVVSEQDLSSSITKKRKTHSCDYRHKGGRLDRLKYSFANRTIPEWNSLPAQVAVEAGSVDAFKSRLAAHRP